MDRTLYTYTYRPTGNIPMQMDHPKSLCVDVDVTIINCLINRRIQWFDNNKIIIFIRETEPMSKLC